MIHRLRAHLEVIRLGIRQRGLRRWEEAALVRLGQAALADGRAREGRLAALAAEAAVARERLTRLDEERRTAIAQAHADLAAVPRWMTPVVLLRGASARAVLRRRRAAIEQRMHELRLTAGRLAMATDTSAAAREVQRIRAELVGAASAHERTLASLAARAEPAWVGRARAEGKHFGGALWQQVRSQLTPRGPALAGMAMGWWITSRYTDSHARSILRSVGIGHGGTHVVSASTFKAMQLGLPLLAAALCAYLGKRLAAAVRPERSSA